MNGPFSDNVPPRGPFRFIAIDVETAGRDIGGICQIGLCGVGPTGDLHQYSVLVDPEQAFAPFNTRLHGISAATVRDAGSFADIYPGLAALLSAHVLVQHSDFDRVAIGAACRRYGLRAPRTRWIDSVKVAREVWPDLRETGGHGLANLKKALGLRFRHHDAGEDARAAAEVILAAEKVQGAPIPGVPRHVQMRFDFGP